MRTKGHHTQQRVGWESVFRASAHRVAVCSNAPLASEERQKAPFESESLQNAPFAKIARFEQLVALFEPLVGAVNKATRTAR